MKQTKKELSKQLYLQVHALPRPKQIETFMRELNMTENSARTHLSNAAKELNTSLGKNFQSRNTSKPTLKKERAKAIVIDNIAKMTRKDLAEKLQAELGMSHNSAQTHISKIAKENGL